MADTPQYNPGQDPDFRAMSMHDKIAYLSSQDKDFAAFSPQDQAGYINHLLGNDTPTPFEQQNAMSPGDRNANSFLLGTASGASGLKETMNPLEDTGKALIPSSPRDAVIGAFKNSFGPLPGLVSSAYNTGKELLTPQQPGESPQDVSERRFHAAGTVAGQGVAAMAGPGVEGVNDAFAADPAVAAQRGLRPPPKQAQSFQKSLPNAQAYLKGSRSLSDLQSNIPGAKNEIWQPYQNALSNIAEQKVNGPDGPTTYGDLERQRLETSAQLQSTRKLLPVDQQGILQKNQGIKQLSDRYEAIRGPLDAGLQSQGIDPQAIRNTFGDVQTMNRLTQGRNTVAEKSQPYGFGRMVKDANILHPLNSIGGVVSGTQDLLAGRPLWSGKPTDVNIAEGFRRGPEKPDFSATPQTMPDTSLPTSEYPSAQVGRGPSAPPSEGERGTTTSGDTGPPPIDVTADASYFSDRPTLPPPTLPAIPSEGAPPPAPSSGTQGLQSPPAGPAVAPASSFRAGTPFAASSLIRKPPPPQ